MRNIIVRLLVAATITAGFSLGGAGIAAAQEPPPSSPGAMDESATQAPVRVSINVCGDIVNIVILLDPNVTFGATC
ncbi:MAG TPA: chaplin family protein [Pseudonocardiaceae bacterium]|nr:chaplin family protein [Pseudonocardiaceae bacterium]